MALIQRNPPKITFTIDCDEDELRLLASGLSNDCYPDGDDEERCAENLEKGMAEALKDPTPPAPAKKKR